MTEKSRFFAIIKIIIYLIFIILNLIVINYNNNLSDFIYVALIYVTVVFCINIIKLVDNFFLK